MAQKRKVNPLKGINPMQQMVLDSAGIVADENSSTAVSESQVATESGKYTWKRFAFVCDKVIVAKVQAIASKEGVTIRELMEFMMNQAIARYEKKNGTIEVTVDTPGKKCLKDLL